MTREIKFRAWNAEHKHMAGPSVLSSRFMEVVESGGYDLMQYTGLKDKNGVEIYEGDIVAIYPHGATEYKLEEANICEVKWSDENCGWVGIFGNIAPWSRHEVIGNIYENKELLDATP